MLFNISEYLDEQVLPVGVYLAGTQQSVVIEEPPLLSCCELELRFQDLEPCLGNRQVCGAHHVPGHRGKGAQHVDAVEKTPLVQADNLIAVFIFVES